MDEPCKYEEALRKIVALHPAHYMQGQEHVPRGFRKPNIGRAMQDAVDIARNALEEGHYESAWPSSTGTEEEIEVTTNSRGLDWAAPIVTDLGGTIQVRESSAANSPHLWLDTSERTLHLTMENARKLRDTLDFMVKYHYQASHVQEDKHEDEKEWGAP